MNYPSSYFKQPNFIFFCDIETTGFDHWRNEILTLSMSCFDYKKLTPQGEIELNFKVSNDKYWGKDAEKIHGISFEKALSFPSKVESTTKLRKFIEEFGLYNVFCCHALKRKSYFDWLFLRTHFAKFGWEFDLMKNINKLESTIDFYKELSKENKISVSNYKLNTLCETMNIELDHHDAKSDRLATEQLYIKGREL